MKRIVNLLLQMVQCALLNHVLISTGRIVHKGSGAVVAETEYRLSEATKGLTKLDIREQELKDMEVARKLQEEELKVRKEAKKALLSVHTGDHCTVLLYE